MKNRLFSIKSSLYSKLVMTYFAVICISFVFLAGLLSIWFEGYYYNQRKQVMLSEIPVFNSLMENLTNGTITLDGIAINLNAFEKFLNARIWMVEKFGYILTTSNKEENELVGKQITAEEIYKVFKGEIISKQGIFQDKFKTPMLTVAFPLTINNAVVGAVIMNSPIYEIKAALNRVYAVIWLCAVIAIIMSTIIIYFLSQRIFIKPLYEINKTARAISGGEFEKRVKVLSKDEIGELGESFNGMADALQNLENLRKDFIANISHELRSPITSIRGFIQGILDGTIPEDKQKYYLSIALGESKRLTRLISDVLDLSRLESGEFSLRMETFDLNELVRINIIRFENEIDNKKLNVDVTLTGNELYVVGDRDRLGQVISNLIDNAIKFTNEGGKIGIKTGIDGKKVTVNVSDSGVGISENELKLIWDRFHMVDKSRTTKRGTGLGLAIVRQIINQHGDKIWVESQEGVGTMFSFTVKLDQSI